MASTKNPPIPVVITLPSTWVPCPLCNKHYVQQGMESKVLCAMIQDE